MNRTSLLRGLLAILLFLSATSMVAARPLFTLLDPLEASDAPAYVIEERPVALEIELLGGSSPRIDGTAERFTVELPDRTSLTLIRERVERNASGSLTWIGRIDEDRAGVVFLVNREGWVDGSLRAFGRYWSLQRRGDRQLLQEINEASPMLREQEPTPVQVEPSEGSPGTGEDGTVIDLLVVYTAQAVVAAGGVGAMESRIELGVAETNQSYSVSGIDTRLNLVGMRQVTYTESGSSGTDRDRLRVTNDGHMDIVHEWRNVYGADLVHLIISSPGCGISYIMTTVSTAFETHGFCVTMYSCISPNYTFGHEMGHIQSARHDWFVDGTNNSPYTYNHGYVDPSSRWRSIMAYSNACGGCQRQLFWSNPDRSHPVTGNPTGVPEGQAQAADNRKTLNNTAPTVANFRPGGFMDGFETGDTAYWSEITP